MKRARTACVGLWASLLPGLAHGMIVLDSFTANPYALTVTSPATINGNHQTAADLYLGSRTNFVYWVGGSPIPTGTASSEVNGGWRGRNQLSLRSTHQMLYGSAGIQGVDTYLTNRALNASLSNFTGIELTLGSATAGCFFTLRLINSRAPGETGIVGSAFWTQEITSPVVSSTVLQFNLASPDGGNALIRNRFDVFVLEVDVPAGGSFEMTRVRAVPEPATLFTLGIGLGLLGRRRPKNST